MNRYTLSRYPKVWHGPLSVIQARKRAEFMVMCLAAELAEMFLAGYRAGREHKGEGNYEALLTAQEKTVAASLKRLWEEGVCKE